VFNYPSYAPQRYQSTLLVFGVLLLCASVNTIGAKALPKIESLILVLHVLGFFAILIPLARLAPHSSASFVFTKFDNLNGWPSNGASWFIGLLSGVFPFLGMCRTSAPQDTFFANIYGIEQDTMAHATWVSRVPTPRRKSLISTTAEEVQDAATTVPWCMVTTIVLNGVLGLGTVVVFLFCIGDMQTALQSEIGYDFIEVFYNATQSKAGTSVMVAILLSLAMFATFGLLASASRQTWAFARDRGLPYSVILSKVKCPRASSYFYLLISKCTLSGPPTSRTSPPSHRFLRHRQRPPSSHNYRLNHRIQRHRFPHHRRPFRLLPHTHHATGSQKGTRAAYPLRSLAHGENWNSHQCYRHHISRYHYAAFFLPARATRHEIQYELFCAGLWGRGYPWDRILLGKREEELPRADCGAEDRS